jgi:hypothetical protein
MMMPHILFISPRQGKSLHGRVFAYERLSDMKAESSRYSTGEINTFHRRMFMYIVAGIVPP